MAKILYFALLFMCISITLAHGDRKQPWYNFFIQALLGTSSVCTTNTTTARTTYLTNMVNLLNSIQANATYNAVLQLQEANFVAYVRNSNNQALLYSDCNAFVAGVKTAKLADAAAQDVRQRINRDIQARIRQVPRNATGSNGPNDMDLDSSEIHGHRS